MKRIFDIAASSVALLVLSPVMLVTAVIARCTMGSPVLFRQPRPGLDGEIFTMTKFRSMRDGDGSDAERLTSVGRFLRSTSLDELPELVHVLRGEMSIVGPRPLLVDYLALYTPHQARRHEVRPGITGLAQVSGRNDTAWADRIDLDVHYVDNRSMLMDLKIIGRTLSTVVRREGISADGEATMERFTGR